MFLAIMMTGILPGVSSFASEKPANTIHVVYDDSGSMYKNDDIFYDRWCHARYAMEVFAAMLGPKDTLKVYPMGFEGEESITVTGSQEAQSRIDAIEAMETAGGNTPFAAVENAYRDLYETQTDGHRWLVVLTDGDFNRMEKDEVDKKLLQFASASRPVKIIFLSIGENSSGITHKPEKGIYFYQSTKNDEMLKQVTEIGNQIFQNLMLPQEYIIKNNKELKLSFDVPMEQIIVFAQGDNVQIGDLKSKQLEPKKTQQVTVKYSTRLPANMEKYRNRIPVDTKLSGALASFGNQDAINPMGDGEYTVSVSDISNVQIYYKPSVLLDVSIYQTGNKLSDSNKLVSGEYEIELKLLNPITGEEVNSPLLQDVQYRTTITNGEFQGSFDTAQNQLVAERGVVDIHSTVELPGYQVLEVTRKIQVLQKAPPLELRADPPEKFNIKDLENEKNAILVTASMENQPLSEELWNNTRLKASTPRNIELEVKKGDVPSTWVIIPKYKVDLLSTDTGEIPVTIEANLFYEEQDVNSSLDTSFDIEGLPFLERLMLWVKKNLVKILVTLFILFMLIGYILKKRLPKMKPKTIRKQPKPESPTSNFLRKNFLTVILPYIAETGSLTVKSGNTVLAGFELKAKGRNTFTLTNPQRNYDKGLYINGVLLAKDESTKPKAVVLSKNTRIDIENEGKYEFYFHSRQNA